MLVFSQIFTSVFFIVFFGAIFYVSGITGVLQTILSLIFYCFITFGFYSIWKYLRKKTALDFTSYIYYFLYRVSVGLLLTGFILLSFSYYFNEYAPTPMPKYTISNGEKTVIFQAMSHIGSQNFYDSVLQDLTEKKEEGYIYYYEGVRPGTEENMEKFDQALGVEFDDKLYENFSKLYGVVHQDNSIYYNVVNDKDYNIDASIDDIIQFYESDELNNIEAHNSGEDYLVETKDLSSEVIDIVSQLNNRELGIIQYLNKAILNAIIGSEQTQSFIQENFSNQRLFEVILEKRNDILAEEIISTQETKIFITYGLLHFKGVLEILQSNDEKWKIIDTQFSYPIQ